MALAPYFNQLPADAKGKRYVSPTKWDEMMDNFINWKFNVNAGGNSLSNVNALHFATGGFVNGVLAVGAPHVDGKLYVQCAGGGRSARFTDNVNSTFIFDHPSPSVARIQVPSAHMVLDASSVTITTGALTVAEGINGAFRARPTGNLSTGGQLHHYYSTLTAGQSINLTTVTGGGTNGLLIFYEATLAAMAFYTVRAGYNAVTEVLDPGNHFATTDTADQICVISAGGGAYTLKNGRAYTVGLSVTFIGF